MDFDQLRQIFQLVREHEVSEFEIEQDGLRVRIRKDSGVPSPLSSEPLEPAGARPAPSVSGLPSPAPVSVGTPADDTEIELAVVKSPIVGTFYRSSEPGTPALVEIGSTVKKGQVLCIIEAMKLMNEIDSEYDGEIVNVYVENGQAVQYGERLFAIRTK